MAFWQLVVADFRTGVDIVILLDAIYGTQYNKYREAVQGGVIAIDMPSGNLYSIVLTFAKIEIVWTNERS